MLQLYASSAFATGLVRAGQRPWAGNAGMSDWGVLLLLESRKQYNKT
jgi:hypothetical protein